jgi:hypothetical protein
MRSHDPQTQRSCQRQQWSHCPIFEAADCSDVQFDSYPGHRLVGQFGNNERKQKLFRTRFDLLHVIISLFYLIEIATDTYEW